jgi:hypothetical protein
MAKSEEYMRFVKKGGLAQGTNRGINIMTKGVARIKNVRETFNTNNTQIFVSSYGPGRRPIQSDSINNSEIQDIK